MELAILITVCTILFFVVVSGCILLEKQDRISRQLETFIMKDSGYKRTLEHTNKLLNMWKHSYESLKKEQEKKDVADQVSEVEGYTNEVIPLDGNTHICFKVCVDCGAMVTDITEHDRWHINLIKAAKSEPDKIIHWSPYAETFIRPVKIDEMTTDPNKVTCAECLNKILITKEHNNG